jgi:hypothetical protein
MKNLGYVKPNTAVVKIGYAKKTAGTWNPQLVRDCVANIATSERGREEFATVEMSGSNVISLLKF